MHVFGGSFAATGRDECAGLGGLGGGGETDSTCCAWRCHDDLAASELLRLFAVLDRRILSRPLFFLSFFLSLPLSLTYLLTFRGLGISQDALNKEIVAS